ncbi:MAG: transporter substrate-binding domain-containing protein [Bacillota bacterium]
MKKVLLAITSILSVVLLSACGLVGDDTLRVGMDLSYPPFETEEDGDPEGISVDVAHELGEYLDRDVEIVDTGFGQLIPSLNSGEIDIVIGSMSITDERDESVDFTDPYFYFKIISLVNRDFADEHDITEDTTHDELLDIDDAKYVGIRDQVSYEIPDDMGLDTMKADSPSSAVYEVVQGERDILMMSSLPVANNHNSNEDDTMIVWDPFEVSPIGMAVREGDEELQSEANEFIAQMDEEDGVYDQLREDWDEEVESRLGRYGLDFFINED